MLFFYHLPPLRRKERTHVTGVMYIMGAESSPETVLQERSAVYFAVALGCGMVAVPLIGGLTLTIYAAVAAIPVMIVVILFLCFAKDDV